MPNQQSSQFYGDIVKRVLVVFQESCCDHDGDSTSQFIKLRFNTVRNYREFQGDYPVQIKKATSGKLPKINSLKKGDACLIMGNGRFIDKNSYLFAQKCFQHGIPVFFIRSNSLDRDPRTNDNPVWKSHTLTTKIKEEEHLKIPPSKYFMQLPSMQDFIVTNYSSELYALFPCMVPTP